MNLKNGIFSILACIGTTLIAGCAGKVDIPLTAVTIPVGLEQVKGKYAVWLQSGGWKLDVKSASFACSAWSFDADINNTFSSAIKTALKSGLERVVFVDGVMSPNEIFKNGYDAQIVFYQGNASAEFGATPNLFTVTAGATVELTAILAILKSKGLAYQITVSGKGSSTRSEAMYIGCPTIGDDIGKAASASVQELGSKSILYVRDALRSNEKAGPPK